jgi:imidazolonepropionase-like amidohydrolase
MSLKRFVVLLSLLLLPSPLIAQTAESAALPKRILIRAGKLLDVRTGRVLTDQAILIEGDRIKEVGAAQTIVGQAPAGTRGVD